MQDCKSKFLIIMAVSAIISSVSLLAIAVSLVVSTFFQQMPQIPEVNQGIPQNVVAPQNVRPAVGKINKKYDNGVTLDEALRKGKPVAVLFYADWCPHCQHFAPFYNKLSKDRKLKKMYTFAYMNADSPESAKAMQEYQVAGFPSFFLINPKTNEKVLMDNGVMAGDSPVGVLRSVMISFAKKAK